MTATPPPPPPASPPPATPPATPSSPPPHDASPDPFAFRSLLDEVVALLRAHPLPLVLPFVLFALLTSGSSGRGPRLDLDRGSMSGVEWLLLLPFMILAGIVGLIVLVLLIAVAGGLALVTARAAYDALQGRAPDLQRAFHDVKPRLVGGILTYVLFALLAFVGMLLLLFPGAFVLGALAPWLVVTALEGITGPDAFRRAWSLTKPHWLPLSLLALAAIGVGLVASLLLGWIPIIGGALVALVEGVLYAAYCALSAVAYVRAGGPRSAVHGGSPDTPGTPGTPGTPSTTPPGP